jgi:hypothetical protein
MTLFLDNERLNGPHVARISTRPRRIALPLAVAGPRSLEDTVELEFQLWGGAANVILPVTSTGQIPEPYRRLLPGSQIDDVHGSGSDPGLAPGAGRRISHGTGVVSRSAIWPRIRST